MNVSDHGLAFIGDWEGLRNRMYDDGGHGRGNATIGIGHLIHLGPIDGSASEQPFLNGLTDDECYALLREDIPRYEAVVDRYAKVPLNQNQYDALVDFCFNTGGGYPSLWSAVNNGGDVCAVLLVTAVTPAWAHDALVRRRQAECDLYNTPVKEDIVQIKDWWTDRSIPAGPTPPQKYEMDLVGDFGPAKAYYLFADLAPDSEGVWTFFNGDFSLAGRLHQPGTVLVYPGRFGTAPFSVSEPGIHVAHLACVGIVP